MNCYIQIELVFNGKTFSNIYMHILILKSFLPDGYNSFEITNHVNGDKLNICLINLEPSDSSDNVIKSQRVLGNNNFVEVRRILINEDDNTEEEITIYDTITEAAIDNKITLTSLCEYIKIGKKIYIDGNFYLFTRQEPIHKRELLRDMTEEEFNKEFKQIGEIIIKKKNGTIIKLNLNKYFISNVGVVVSLTGNKKEIMQPIINCGYLQVSLSYLTKAYPLRISRLVLLTYNENKYIELNGEKIYYWELVADHIDHNILNNSINNLQWLTYRGNSIRSQIFKCIKITSLFYQTTTVLPAARILATLYNTNVEFNIQKAAITGNIFLGNKIEYITIKDYHDEKINNNPLIMFTEKKYTVKKYDIQTQKLIQTYVSVKDTCRNNNFGISIFNNLISKATSIDYLHDYNGTLIKTPLKCKYITYSSYLWLIIFGAIELFDKNIIQEKCDDFEKTYVKMRNEK